MFVANVIEHERFISTDFKFLKCFSIPLDIIRWISKHCQGSVKKTTYLFGFQKHRFKEFGSNGC